MDFVSCLFCSHFYSLCGLFLVWRQSWVVVMSELTLWKVADPLFICHWSCFLTLYFGISSLMCQICVIFNFDRNLHLDLHSFILVSLSLQLHCEFVIQIISFCMFFLNLLTADLILSIIWKCSCFAFNFFGVIGGDSIHFTSTCILGAILFSCLCPGLNWFCLCSPFIFSSLHNDAQNLDVEQNTEY